MKTWIVCADRLCAKVFLRDDPHGEARFCWTIPCPSRKSRLGPDRKSALKRFVHYVAEELEIACGAGTESRLILCAESEVLEEYLRELGPSIGSSIVGTISRNLCKASRKYLTGATRSLHHGGGYARVQG